MALSRTAFEKRFAPYQSRLFGYAVALSHDRDLARDLLHECVVRAMAARETPASEAAYRAWLFTILRNLWIDHIRTSRRKADLEEALSADDLAVPTSLESVVVNVLAVRQTFQRLSLEHRDVLALIDISGFSYDEAAGILAIPRGTVMSRISRARQALASLLSDNPAATIPFTRKIETR